MAEKIALVDEHDNIKGYADKLEVHQKGMLHRAFSIFVFNSKNQLLLQKRAKHKYHSGGLWTNTCCSHQLEGEDMEVTIHKRLQEEMGFDCKLKKAFKFQYSVTFDNGLVENEIDHVFVGESDVTPVINPEEAEGWKWMDIEEIRNDIEHYPGNYTYWFRLAITALLEKYFEKIVPLR